MQDLELQTSVSATVWTFFGFWALIILHLVQIKNKLCQLLPLAQVIIYLLDRQMDLGQPMHSNAHTSRYKVIIAVGNVAAIYEYHGAILQPWQPSDILPLEKSLIIKLITSELHWKYKCGVREGGLRFTYWKTHYRLKISCLCTAECLVD